MLHNSMHMHVFFLYTLFHFKAKEEERRVK